jgi:hypothetical protein
MKRIIDGVTYNTATSTELARATWSEDNEGEIHAQALYQTNKGAFFVHINIERQTWDARRQEHVTKEFDEFVPKSPEEAHKWLMEGDTEVFHNPFDDPPEAAAEQEPGATIYIRVPASLKRRVEEASRETKLSGNVWAMRCVERCLDPNPAAKSNLADVHDILLMIRAHAGDGLSNEQVCGIAQEAIKKLETAWIDLGFDDPSEHSDLCTRIMGHANSYSRDRLQREYPLYND